MKKQLLYVLTLAMVCVWVQPAVGVFTTDKLILQHDYFAASGLTDINTEAFGTRDGVLRPLSTLVAPSGGNPGYVQLVYQNNDERGSGVDFARKDGTETWSLADANESLSLGEMDVSFEIWIDFDASNPQGTDDSGLSDYVFFQKRGPTDDYNTRLRHNFSDTENNTLAAWSPSSQLDGSLTGGDATYANIVGLHQYVWVFDGEFWGNNGTWTIYQDGALMLDGDGLPVTGTYGTWGGTYGLLGINGSGDPTPFSVGGANLWGASPPGTHTPEDLASPAGKLYRFLIYADALTAAEIEANYNDGWPRPLVSLWADAGGPYVIAAGETLTLDASGSWNPDYITSYSWDLDNDGIYETDGGGPLCVLSYAYLASLGLDVGGPYDIRLKVTDVPPLFDTAYSQLTITPEPATLGLLLLGGLALLRRKRST